jgi:hypothetical protein
MFANFFLQPSSAVVYFLFVLVVIFTNTDKNIEIPHFWFHMMIFDLHSL